jgi:phospholipid transport system transporter-binding protein
MPNATDHMSDNTLPLPSITVANATAALAQGVDALRAGQTVFDLRNVQTVDSAAVSVMLAWQRAARDAGVTLELRNLPPMLRSLTKLYGVCELVAPTQTDCGAAGAEAAATHHHHHHH